jgi:hypothetical protein
MTDTDFLTPRFDELCGWFGPMQRRSEESLHLYALVDGVLDEMVLPQIIQRDISWSNLYPPTMLESSTPAAAPYLVDLTPGERDHAAAMRLLLRRGQDKDLVLWVASRQRLRDLAAHCHPYAEVVLPDRRRALLRYYDASIMKILIRAFSDEQREHFLSAFYECRYWEDGWSAIGGKDYETLPPVLEQPIALTNEQCQVLGDDSFAQTLYHHLKPKLVSSMAGIEKRQCIDHIRQLLARATERYKLTKQQDLAYFALLGLNVNLTFDAHPQIVERLLANPGSHDPLSLRLSHVEDAVWLQLRDEASPVDQVENA